MDRIAIEVKLNQDRAWLLEQYAAMPAEDLTQGVTPSEHDPSSSWSAKDHLSHLAAIERDFQRMIRLHLAGDPNPVALLTEADGTPRPREQVMAIVHELTEGWAREHRPKSLSELVAMGQEVRAGTLALLAEVTDKQLLEKVPGAPWGDGTIGTMLAIHGDHSRVHLNWVKGGLERAAQPVAGS